MKYLLILLALFATAAMAERRQIEDWAVSIFQDDFTDETKAIAISYAENDRSGMMGVRCFGDEIAAAVTASSYLASENTYVIYRFDNEGPVTLRVPVSSDGTFALFYDLEFIENMRRKTSLVVRLHDYNGTIEGTYRFSLIGASDAIGLVNCQ